MDREIENHHIPVMLPEVLALLELKVGMRVVDATLGAGGYTRKFLEHVGPTGQVIAFDWDQAALENFQNRFKDDEEVQTALTSGRLLLVHAPYSLLTPILQEKNIGAIDAIVADLGLSSLQLDNPERGLSFQTDGPLDMRLNSQETVTAADIVNHWSVEALAELFETYADEGEARRIAEAIGLARKQAPILRTKVLADLVRANVVKPRRLARIHPATKVFQALRMAVNSEAQELSLFLEAAKTVLADQGKFVVVSFHSGEDGLVKRAFQAWEADNHWTILTKKPIVPTDEEQQINPRSRSAKLRGIQKQQ